MHIYINHVGRLTPVSRRGSKRSSVTREWTPVNGLLLILRTGILLQKIKYIYISIYTYINPVGRLTLVSGDQSGHQSLGNGPR